MTFVAVSLLAGCAAPAPSAPKHKPKPQIPVTINTGPGTADAFGPMPGHEIRWTVRWKSSQVNATESQMSGGAMSDVTGTIYDEKGRPELTFSARTGIGDKQSNVLRLHGNVHVTSLEQRETLTSDELVYNAKAKLLDATGNVQFQGNVGSIGTFSELMATSDFKRVGTPDMFANP